MFCAKVKQNKEDTFTLQEGYTNEVLKIFKMKKYKLISTLIKYDIKYSKWYDGDIIDPTNFKSLLENLRHLNCIRLYILYIIGLVSQFMKKPRSTHMKATKRILRYVKSIITHGLLYLLLIIFYFLYILIMCSWRLKKIQLILFSTIDDTTVTRYLNEQSIVALSTCKVKYKVGSSCVHHIILFMHNIKLHRYIDIYW